MGWFSSNNNDEASASTSRTTSNPTSNTTQPAIHHSSLPLPKDTTTPLKPSIPKTTVTKRNPETKERDAAVPDDWLPVMTSKQVSKYTDPCAHAAKASTKCLEENGYDRQLCMKQFQDYRDCKKAWVLQRRSDRLAGRQGSFD